MHLTTVWFVLIAVLWAGYFLLEGFDFGVGILLPVLGRDERERRLLINTIGPVWDGNEVWLLVAGGRHVRRVPGVVRHPVLRLLPAAAAHPGRADPARGGLRVPRQARRAALAAPLGPVHHRRQSGAGAAVGRGVRQHRARGAAGRASTSTSASFFDLLNPYALLGGLTTLTLFALHGAVFLALKTDGEMRERAGRLAGRLALPAVVIAAAFLVWTGLVHRDAMGRGRCPWSRPWRWSARCWPTGAGGRAGRSWPPRRRSCSATAALFVTLFPNVLPSTIADANSLTVTNASSTPYTLKIMTWVAVVFTPIVLAYQAWTYWVFRKRLRVEQIPASRS